MAAVADIKPMAIRSVAQSPTPTPVPKALCPSCLRPVAMLKTGKCSYCGESIPGLVRLAEPSAAIPPELELLSPSPVQESSRARWIKGIVIFGASTVVLGALMGACMKS